MLTRLHYARMMMKDCQLFDKITTYPYGTNVGKVCKTELLSKVIIK